MEEKLTKKEVEEAKLLTKEEVEKLNFNELCLYLGLLDEMEKIMEEGE